MPHILIVDDEDAIVELIEIALLQAGYNCTTAMDGAAAADLIEANEYDLVLLDIMLPEINGYDLMEYIAPTGTPVIFLTAKNTVVDRIKGLKMGADDYIVKPFNQQELVARVETVLRRTGRTSSLLSAFDVVMDTTGMKVTKKGESIKLTPKEFQLLEVLMRNRGIALYRDVLYEKAWGGEPDDGNRILDLNILRLRRKLGWKNQIRTVSKVGYILENDV
jgi:DNA-binding response OmpR family regulator